MPVNILEYSVQNIHRIVYAEKGGKGGNPMNDRAVSMLENYEINVLRTYRGRSAIICETDQGLKVLREYRGTEERIARIDQLLRAVREKSGYLLDTYVQNKEGTYLCRDREQNTYLLKDYYEGKECVPEDMSDIGMAFAHMAKLHKAMRVPLGAQDIPAQGNNGLLHEIHKRNAELKRGKKFIRGRANRSNFENFLLVNYDFFLKKALTIEEELKEEDFSEYDRAILAEGAFCHGDFQYHNIVFTSTGPAVMNFEKFQWDSGIKDFSLFFRKVMEKNGWDPGCAEICTENYLKERELSSAEKKLLLYRLSYPEKFWKIVNFYINSRKSVVMERNTDKLKKVMEQEPLREKGISFLESLLYNVREGR